MSQRNEYYLKLAHNCQHSSVEAESTDNAGLACVLIGALMMLILTVTM